MRGDGGGEEWVAFSAAVVQAELLEYFGKSVCKILHSGVFWTR